MMSELPLNGSERPEISAPSQHYNGKSFTTLRTDDLVGTYFETLEAADKFYFDYGHAIGFSVRRDKKVPGKDIAVSIRQWCCSCAGLREVDEERDAKRVRTPQKVTRTGCKAAFTVNYRPEKKQYVVKKFITDHNHYLVPPALTHHMRSARNCGDSEVAQMTVLQSVPIQTCHAYEYLVDKAGRYVNVGVRIKDLYNKLDASRREIILDGDTEAALSFLSGIGVGEDNFYCKFSVDEENKLCNLFWRDTRSLIDYEKYGDVVLFDATYKTNCNEKPLVLFVGSSNHLTSIVFGCALLLDETIESYTWALQTFISSMNDRKPVAVLTDGSESMRRALEIVIPGCPHRLCSWHIAKNVSTNVKNQKMRERFIDIMWESATPEEFEKSWIDMIQEFPPKNTSWFDLMYAKRKKWVEAYCKGKFFARMQSTQRCEGMNSYVKDFLNGVKLVEVVPGIIRAQGRLRSKYSEIEFNCMYSKHRLRTELRDLEKDASEIYTDNVFLVVRKEIERVGGLITKAAVESDGFKTYNMWNHNRVDLTFDVVYSQGEGGAQFMCSCRKMEYEGIPCCHIFNVLKHEFILKIPISLVMKRWTVTGKSDVGMLDTHWRTNFTGDAESKLRFGHMCDRLSKLALRASSSKEIYEMVCEEIDKLEKKLEAMSVLPEVNSCGENQSSGSSEDEMDAEGRGEVPQVNVAGPSSTIPYQQLVHQFPFPPGCQYQGSPGMQNLGSGYPQMYGSGLFNQK